MSEKCTLRYCDCHKENTAACSYCSRSKEHAEGKLSDEYVSYLDQTTKLYEYLVGGDMPDGVKCWQPKMSRKHAFSVIWFLQEIVDCLPDHIEQCKGCDDLFNTHSEGWCLDDQYELNGKTLPEKYWGHWCDNCAPDVDFQLG